MIYRLADRFNCGVDDVLGWSVEEVNTRIAYLKSVTREFR